MPTLTTKFTHTIEHKFTVTQDGGAIVTTTTGRGDRTLFLRIARGGSYGPTAGVSLTPEDAHTLAAILKEFVLESLGSRE